MNTEPNNAIDLPPRPPNVRLVVEPDALIRVVEAAMGAHRVALDVEASGMHAYRANACTVQLSWDNGDEVVVVDALATPLSPLAALLGPNGPPKIVHDVAFDARLLAESGITLGNVHDTAIAARMLGRQATGLASLLEGELSVRISKTMQHHDWRIRPLDDAMLIYLALDVVHLESLERKLWAEVTEKGIELAVLEETRYRIACAGAGARAPVPGAETAYFRVKGTDRLSERELSALRAVAEARELEAETRDVPPHKVASAEALVALARVRPTTAADVSRVRGIAMSSPEAGAFLERLARALASAGNTIPIDERSHFEPAPLPTATIKVRREREARLMTWRRAEAKKRAVDEQVVLPGHCVKYAVGADIQNIDDLAHVPGIGTFRVEIDGEAIVRALHGDEIESLGDILSE